MCGSGSCGCGGWSGGRGWAVASLVTSSCVHSFVLLVRSSCKKWCKMVLIHSSHRSCGKVEQLPRAFITPFVMACQLALKLSRPTAVLTRDEAYAIECLCNASASWMSLRARDWINDRRDQATLMHYGCDCTPCRRVTRYVALLGELAISRSGRICEDLLAQRLMLGDSDFSATTVLVEPRQLANKT